MSFYQLCYLSLIATFAPCLALDNGLARVPPMGWNSWNKFHCDVNETVLFKAADRFLQLGLADIGYEYVNIDDCWMSPNRTTKGEYQANPQKFPSGMKAVGDYIHALGLKFGVYTSAGTLTCAGFPASLGREEQDSETFASWGVDYLKYDNCHNHGIPGIERYSTMRDALLKTGRPILYSLCQWGEEQSWRWAPQVGNVWRTTGDISPIWNSIKRNFLLSQQHAAKFTGPGAWADPDMLEIGNGNLTLPEQRSHFSMWALAKAPLILGMDLEHITDEELKIVTNKNLIAVNQDPNAEQALCYLGCGIMNQSSIGPAWSAFATTATGGDVVMMVINWSSKKASDIVMSAQDVGVVPSYGQTVHVKDLWINKMVGRYTFKSLLSLKLPPIPSHGCVVWRFSAKESVGQSIE